MMTVDEFESRLNLSLVNAILDWVKSGEDAHQLKIVESVPMPNCSELVRLVNRELMAQGQHLTLHNGEKTNLSVYEFVPGVRLQDLHEQQVNEERATELRNKLAEHRDMSDSTSMPGVSIMLIAPPSSKFPSISSAFASIAFSELIRRAAVQLYLEADGRNDHIIRSLDIQKWLDGTDVEVRFTEGYAYLISMISAGAERHNVGRELWRIGLIPDVGIDREHGDFTERIVDNRRVVKSLSTSGAKKKVAERLVGSGVGLTPVTKRALRILEGASLETAGGSGGWCRSLLYPGDGQQSDALTFDKWDLEVDEGDLDDLLIVPFRDGIGKATSRSKLHQDRPHGFSEALYVRLELDQNGDGKKAPVVVVDWETKPARPMSVGAWRLSVVVPSSDRGPDHEPLLVKKIKSSSRSHRLKLELSVDDFPDPAGSGSLIVAIEIAAVSQDDEMVMTMRSGRPAIAESEEFEIRLSDQEPGPGSRSSVDDAVSPAEARVSASLSGHSSDTRRVYVRRDDRSCLDIRFQDFEGNLLATRTVRTVPVLLNFESHFLRDPQNAHGATRIVSHEGGQATVTDQVHDLDLPERLLDARSRFFEVVRLKSQTPDNPSVTTIEWGGNDIDLSNCLREYIEAFEAAVEESDNESLERLLRLDTLSIKVVSGDDSVSASILLPTHPLRSAWLNNYWNCLSRWVDQLDVFETTERSGQVDLEMVQKIAPSNLPFVVASSFGEVLTYNEEISFGFGVYLSIGFTDHESAMRVILGALEASKQAPLEQRRISSLRRTVDRYIETRGDHDVLGLCLVNPGDGDLIRAVLAPRFRLASDDFDDESAFRLDICAYSDRLSLYSPITGLVDLQSELSGIPRAGVSHLTPPMSLSFRPLSMLEDDGTSVNLSVVHGLAKGVIAPTLVAGERSSLLGGLLTGTQTSRTLDSLEWTISPTTKVMEADETNRFIEAHRLLLMRSSRRIAEESEGLGIRVRLDKATQVQLKLLHERSDRVVIFDRLVGVDWFQKSRELGLGRSYVLDYTPDFVEGMSDRMIVTTSHREEVRRVVEVAMIDMGLSVAGTATQVLDHLNIVSGRLVLNLVLPTPQAHEAVGLAIVIAVLRGEDDLDGWIVIPVDSHLEVFGPSLLADGLNQRRCDLILARFENEMFEIRCVEVKERSSGSINERLRRRISHQLDSTEAVLRARYLDTTSPRVDRELQQAHFVSLLHHYIDRSRDCGLVDDSIAASYHRAAEVFATLKYQITKEAYVVSVNAQPRSLESYGDVTIRTVTSADLVRTSFTSEAEARIRTSDTPISGAESTSGSSQSNEAEVEKAGQSETFEKGESRENQLIEVDDQGVSSRPVQQGTDPSCVESGVRGGTDAGTDRGEVRGGSAELGDTVDPDQLTVDAHVHSAEAGELPVEISVKLGVDSTNEVVPWKVSTKGSPHAFVLGITGQGKSVTTRHVIASFAEAGLPSLVIDMHGDMAANPPVGTVVRDVRSEGLGFSPFYLTDEDAAGVTEASYELAEIFTYVCKLGPIQLANVYKAVKEVYSEKGWKNGDSGVELPTIEEFADCVERIEKGARGRNARERLLPLTDFGLFKRETSRFDPRGDGRGLVLDLHSFRTEQVTWAATSLVLRKIYRDMFRWPQDSRLKLAVVLDEAHRIVKDPTLPKLMKEGRKYGVVCFVASQSISDFDDEVVNNAGSKIIFRTNFPESRSVATLMRGADRDEFARQIERLSVGEAFVSTPELPKSRRTKMTGRGL